MLTEGDREFVYDKDGNLVQGYTKDGFAFTATYDAEDRLSTISYTDNENVLHKTVYTYRYDSFLVKIAKYKDNALTEETRIVRAGFLELQDRDQNNAVVREYTWGLNLGGGIGGLVNIRQNGENFHPLYDGKGNIIALLDSTGAVAAQYRYDTFGRLTAKTGTLDQPFGFSTKRTDPELGLVYYGYRFYNPDLERWMNRDPLGEEGGINLYGFVGNNPVNWVDPWGLVDLNLFHPTNDSFLYNAANNIAQERGVFTVGAHGDANGIVDQDGKRVGINDLARQIRAAAGKRGLSRVELLSCNVGHGDYAQKLSKALRIEVRAADNYVWYDSSGNLTVAPYNAAGTGKHPTARGTWRRFFDPRQPK